MERLLLAGSLAMGCQVVPWRGLAFRNASRSWEIWSWLACCDSKRYQAAQASALSGSAATARWNHFLAWGILLSSANCWATTVSTRESSAVFFNASAIFVLRPVRGSNATASAQSCPEEGRSWRARERRVRAWELEPARCSTAMDSDQIAAEGACIRAFSSSARARITNPASSSNRLARIQSGMEVGQLRTPRA